MNYFKKLIISSKEIIITYIIQYVIIVLLSMFYLSIIKGNDLANFLSLYGVCILNIFYIVFIIISLKTYPQKETRIKSINHIPLISLGISISVIYNMLIVLITKNNITTTMNIYLLILSSSIIGPIFEEILFRYIFLNKLKKFNSISKSVIINTLVFGLLHNNLTSIIYALILGYILNMIYLKYDNLKANIIVHISANMVVVFLYKFDINLLILSFISLIISIILIRKR